MRALDVITIGKEGIEAFCQFCLVQKEMDHALDDSSSVYSIEIHES